MRSRLQLRQALLAQCLTVLACSRNDVGTPAPAVHGPAPAVSQPRREPEEPKADELAEPTAAPEPDRHRPPRPLTEREKDDKPVETARYLLDDENDVGPAAPAAAYSHGVVLVTRDDELALARLSGAPSKSRKPVKSPMQEIALGPQHFWPVARGPAVSATHVYWISKGRLVRRAVAGGDLEVLATDAREGTRVAVAGSPDVVAYITQPVEKKESLARLRLPDGRKLELTPEGAAASSVSLTASGGDVIASYIDGRSGMTPVHARRLHLPSGTLDPDVVVWVSGATQGLTEIASVGSSNGAWLMLPVERDASHFGLATLAVARDPQMDPPLRFRTYEDGLDRAPVAAAELCGSPVAAYVRPYRACLEAESIICSG